MGYSLSKSGKLKTIAIVASLVILLAAFVVASLNYDFMYNPYTGKQDRSLAANQSGSSTNVTVDNLLVTDCVAFSSGGSLCTGI